MKHDLYFLARPRNFQVPESLPLVIYVVSSVVGILFSMPEEFIVEFAWSKWWFDPMSCPL